MVTLLEPATTCGGSRSGRRNRRRGSAAKRNGTAYLYLLPAFLLFGPLVLYPLIHGLWISFYKWDGLSPATWAGLGNYREAFTDSALRSTFTHSLTLIIFYALIPVTLALALTAILSANTKQRGFTFFRAVLFLPQVVSSVVVATVWTAIYQPQGVLNHTLDLMGPHAVSRPWLGDFRWALPAVGLIGTWVEIGLCLVLFMAGVSQISRELFEAVRMDGGGRIREFFTIMLPGLRPQIVVALTLTVIAALKNFDLVFITTRGGPGSQTSVPAFEVYHRAFDLDQVGSACAVGVLLTIIILIVAVLINRIDPKQGT